MSHPKRLLIVDDEETLTFSLYQTFINAPIACEVITAPDGLQAWHRFSEAPFDLVITDIAMPGMSGLELLEKVKAQNPDTQVVVITAYGSQERREDAQRLGADQYVEKPFDIKELKELVIKLLGS